ncbi:MAG TPA: nucleotide sugar dehydrogenase [bacterium]|nr:nucleotide sugar dehydrogenase [bacterium]HNT67426.1 nucleotide sugar dehydrogenase [bacterium]HOX85642.1 nucleotide sugar dehydrogenase [bacterium]HPG44801.1 nucleotide sugar dehydrogenase [bacterium]HPM99686.1 nucleotide sugar dehydrogenase [bacterium]
MKMDLREKINRKEAVVGVVGLGYVGLPLLLEFASRGLRTMGFDIDKSKVDTLAKGKSYIKHIPTEKIADLIKLGKNEFTTDYSRTAEADVLLLALPTPLDEHREPDLSYIVNTAQSIKPYLRKGQMVILESSTWPGTTAEVVAPILAQSGLKENVDFWVAFSPEREDPNNPKYTINNIPKVVGADDPYARECAIALYSLVTTPVPVSSTRVAESAKLLENIFRSVNIALVNEMKMIMDRMGIDVWEVISAASTKPFGFMPFYPGPGLGGHCIPIDPFYLTWKAHEYDMPTRFIELAGDINTAMPSWVVAKIMSALNSHKKSLNGSRLLILGVAYKKDIDDMRETPALKLMELLREQGAAVDYYDPYVPKLPPTRKYQYDMTSIELTPAAIAGYDAVVVVTDHTAVDYQLVLDNARLIVDTRNVYKQRGHDKIVSA